MYPEESLQEIHEADDIDHHLIQEQREQGGPYVDAHMAKFFLRAACHPWEQHERDYSHTLIQMIKADRKSNTGWWIRSGGVFRGTIQ